MKKTILRKTIAGACILLFLTGCGSTTAQTTTRSMPESEAAKFGGKVVDMLNNGKAEELFDLWKGSSEEDSRTLKTAVAPATKTKGITWEYEKGDFGATEGTITLDYTIDENKEQVKFKTVKVDGEWRLETRPFAQIIACNPSTVDGFDAPIVDNRGDGKRPCGDLSYDRPGTEGEVLLVLPGKHEFSFQAFEGIFKQPYEAMIYPVGFYSPRSAVPVCHEMECEQVSSGHYESGHSNIIPSDLTIVNKDVYVEAVKKALLDSVDYTESCSGYVCRDYHGGADEYRPVVFNDDLTVTPTDNPIQPTFGGTAQISTEDTSKTVNVSDFDITLTIYGVARGEEEDDDAGIYARVTYDDNIYRI